MTTIIFGTQSNILPKCAPTDGRETKVVAITDLQYFILQEQTVGTKHSTDGLAVGDLMRKQATGPNKLTWL
jgi:hypothetical protein